MAKTQETQYTILRTDLYEDQKALEAVLEDYKEKGLNVEEEVKKLISLGYIKKNS
jgi:hypothetical protein